MLNTIVIQVSYIGIIILTLSFREYIKAYTSYKLGNKAVKLSGRLNPNPLKSIDKLGLLVGYFYGFGWGKPVTLTALYYKDRKKGTILVYSLPIIINLTVGTGLFILLKFINLGDSSAMNIIVEVIKLTAKVNLFTGLFNLIPIYPCDGFFIFKEIGPASAINTYIKQEASFQLLLLVLIFFNNILSSIFYFITKILFGDLGV